MEAEIKRQKILSYDTHTHTNYKDVLLIFHQPTEEITTKTSRPCTRNVRSSMSSPADALFVITAKPNQAKQRTQTAWKSMIHSSFYPTNTPKAQREHDPKTHS